VALADTQVTLSEIDLSLVKELGYFEPFGMGNPAPLLLTQALEVTEIRVLKNAHLKVMLTDGERYLTGLMWRRTEHPALFPGAKVDIAFRPDVNSFRGSKEIQAIIQAVELTD